MSSRIPEIYRDAGKAILAKHVPTLVGKPSASVSDRKKFEDLLVAKAWHELPLPCRMLGRQRLGWDDLFEQVRTQVYDASGPAVKLQPDAAARVTEAFKRTVADVATRLKVANAAKSEPAPGANGTARPEPGTQEAAKQDAAKTEPPKPVPNPNLAIGIDLGTTFSAVAWVDSDGRPIALENSSGDLITPSVVYFEDEGTVVGKEAAHVSLLEPERVAECVKRDMGSKQYRKRVNGEYVPPEVVSSILLRSLKADAERRLGPLAQAVITVPAYFDEPRRQATVNAGKLAGLDVLDILNEPTAAAICYGHQKGFFSAEAASAGKPLKVLVYDLGGGTFDVTVLAIDGQNFTVVATDGDVRLGGKDWDEKLVTFAAERYIAEHREDPRTNPASLQELFSSAEQAKRALSERSKATLFINHLGQRMKVDVTRQQFEEATAPLLARTRHTCDVVLRAGKLSWAEIDRVVLVGGSTRMPMVQTMLEELCQGVPIDRSLSPDLAVAHGAALYADLLLKRRKAGEGTPAKFHLTNVNSHSLGIVGIDKATNQKINHVLIPKNTALPHSVTQAFKLAKANQKRVKIQVLEGESRRPDGCTQVGVCTIENLPDSLADGASIDITYEYEQNGRLHVSAQLRGYTAIFRTTFERESTLDEKEMGAWTDYVAHESRRMSEA